MKKFVGIFFYCEKKLELFTLEMEETEEYGDFCIYPYSHDEIWEKYLRLKYVKDYDYYPRGRIIYNKKEKKFWIYRDKCIPLGEMEKLGERLGEYVLLEDDHYVCHQCSEYYE